MNTKHDHKSLLSALAANKNDWYLLAFDNDQKKIALSFARRAKFDMLHNNLLRCDARPTTGAHLLLI